MAALLRAALTRVRIANSFVSVVWQPFCELPQHVLGLQTALCRSCGSPAASCINTCSDCEQLCVGLVAALLRAALTRVRIANSCVSVMGWSRYGQGSRWDRCNVCIAIQPYILRVRRIPVFCLWSTILPMRVFCNCQNRQSRIFVRGLGLCRVKYRITKGFEFRTTCYVYISYDCSL